MEMTARHAAWLHALAVRDNLVVQIAVLAALLLAIYLVAVRGSRRPGWWVAAFTGVFYASLFVYFLLGL